MLEIYSKNEKNETKNTKLNDNTSEEATTATM